MNKIHVVCLGSCDMYPTYGFVGGIKKAGAKVTSYGESNNDAHSMIYHLERKENQNSINNADLIIVGWISNSCYEDFIPVYKILYNKLHKFNKKILICIWLGADLSEKMEKFHYGQICHYGFNLVDVRKYCKEKQIFEFYTSYRDCGHPFYAFMSGISRRIVNEFDKLQYPKQVKTDDIEMAVIPFSNFIDENAVKKTRTFTLYEKVCQLKNGNEIKIPTAYRDYTLMGIHMFNGAFNGTRTHFILRNQNKQFSVSCFHYNYVVPIYDDHFVIDEKTFIKCSSEDTFANLGLIAMLCLKDNRYLQDSHYVECESLDPYDFSYILEFLIEGKEFIGQYNLRQDLSKARIHNHLSYKLGQALIINSKSLWGYLRIPFVLSYIKDKHRQDQKAYKKKIKDNPSLALPSLESYPEEVLKEKECFTYKLGKALIEANKTWYKGGYLKFYFEDVPKLKREFKKI